MTYYTNILITLKFSRSSNFTFDHVFLNMLYFNSFEKETVCACNYSLKPLQTSN
jgi:hypothetical protein